MQVLENRAKIKDKAGQRSADLENARKFHEFNKNAEEVRKIFSFFRLPPLFPSPVSLFIFADYKLGIICVNGYKYYCTHSQICIIEVILLCLTPGVSKIVQGVLSYKIYNTCQ